MPETRVILTGAEVRQLIADHLKEKYGYTLKGMTFKLEGRQISSVDFGGLFGDLFGSTFREASVKTSTPSKKLTVREVECIVERN